MTPTQTLDLFQAILENTGQLLGIAVSVAALHATTRGRDDDRR